MSAEVVPKGPTLWGLESWGTGLRPLAAKCSGEEGEIGLLTGAVLVVRGLILAAAVFAEDRDRSPLETRSGGDDEEETLPS